MSTRDVPADLGAVVCRVLDPVLVPRGFAAGQVGFSEREVGVTFCGPGELIRQRFGPLVAESGAGPDDDAWCHDVVVRVGIDAGGGSYLDEVRLDGSGLDRLLRTVDRDDLAPEAVGLDFPRDPGGSGSTALSSLLVSGEVVYDRRALSSIGPTGPLGRLPLDRALARVAELLDVAFTEAERHPVWWDRDDPWAEG